MQLAMQLDDVLIWSCPTADGSSETQVNAGQNTALSNSDAGNVSCARGLRSKVTRDEMTYGDIRIR